MASAVRRLGSLSMARGCARIDAGPDTAKIGSADRVQDHHARLIAVIGVRKTYPHGLDPERTFGRIPATSRSPLRHPGDAHALIHTLASGEVSRIVALCAAAEAAEGEGRIEHKAHLRGGPRLV